MMSLRYGIFCLLLLFIVALLTVKNYEVWTQPFELETEKGTTKKSEKKTEMDPTFEGQKNPTPIEYYLTISEKNIFSPERKDFPIPIAPVGETKKPVARPQIVLYGVMIVGDYQAASIVNPGRPLHKGERLSP